MSDGYSSDASLLNSIIGEGTRFGGELDLNGLLRIDGDFSGTIRTRGKILIGLNGRAECNIYAETIVVGGIVKGNLFSTEKVVVLSTGMLIGNISAPRLVVEEGVILNGNVRITGAATGVRDTRPSVEQSRQARAGGHAYSREPVSSRN